MRWQQQTGLRQSNGWMRIWKRPQLSHGTDNQVHQFFQWGAD